MSDHPIKSFSRKVGDHLWLILIVLALVIVSISSFANKGADFTRIASGKMEKLIDRRLDLLEDYMQRAYEQPHDQWLDLEGLPKDMVIYRYVCDTLQSWCHQFTIANDDIANKLVIERLSNEKYKIESQLSAVTHDWQYLNIGPEWYLIRKIGDDLDCQIIAGLEVKSMVATKSRNGVNRQLNLSDRFALYPISYAGGAPVIVKGKPMLKIVQEDAHVLPLNITPYLTWLSVCLVIIGILLYLIRHKSIRHMLLTMLSIIVVIFTFFLMGKRLNNTLEVFSPTIYAQGDFFYSLGALLLMNLLVFLLVLCLYLVGPALLRWLLRGKRSRLKCSLFATGILMAVIGLVVYIHLTFSSVLMNSSFTLELYKISQLDRYMIYVYLSYISLMVSLLMLIQLLRPLARLYLHWNYNIFSRPWRILFCVLCSLYFLLTSTVLSSRKEASTVEIWSNAMSIDRDMGFELQLRGIEDYIENDPVVTRLIAQPDDYSLVLGRISETYLNRIARDYDVVQFVYTDNQPDPAVINFFNDRIKNGVPISENSRFHYSRTSSGRSRYTGMFSYYVKDQGVVRILIGIDSKVDKGGRGYSAILGTDSYNKVVLPSYYSYGKYISGKLVMYKGEYAYPTVLSADDGVWDTAKSSEVKVIGRYVHFMNRVSDEEIIIISRLKNDYMQYMVSFFLVALLAYIALSLFLIGRKRRPAFDSNYYTSRINTVLFVSLILTLVVMAVISVIFVYRRNDANTKNIMTSKVNTIQSLVEANSRYLNAPSDFNTSESMIILRDISDYTRSDITLYTMGGKAFRTTAPEEIGNLILASRMNQEAYNNIMYQHRRYFIHKEYFGEHSYFSMYAPIFNQNGKMLAIVGAPYTDGGVDFMNDAVTHSIFIITMFFILLIVARLLTNKVVEKMFQPLIDMGNKMKSAQNGELEYIIYDREDEISSVVRSYNLMVHDLSVSAQQLTVAERDKAWREMARQVAHEIKTPLTPIKLLIQRIIRLRSKKDPGWEEKFDKILPTIISSIDQLADTANDFSSFAKLYSEEHQLIDLDQMMNETVALFNEKDNIEFEYIGLEKSLIMGPKPQLHRVFVNLVTNAIQAIENGTPEGDGQSSCMGKIRLSVRNSNEGDYYDVVFEDNGPGVKDENRSKLFVPNFTTKSSGSGLGLAISKNILEICGGTIAYSKSFSLQGACFTVRLPKWHPAQGA